MRAGGRHNTIAEIDAAIASARADLRRLQDMRREAIEKANAPYLADFDAGMNIGEIAKARGVSYSTAQGILLRSGRTQGGRMAIRHQLASIGSEARA